MKKVDCQILRYSLPLGFFVEIDIQGNEFGAWLYHRDYGVKSFMFGNDPRNTSLSGFLELVEANIDSYVDFYRCEYMDF